MVMEVEYIFMHLSAISISSFESCLLISVAHLLVLIVCFKNMDNLLNPCKILKQWQIQYVIV